MKKILLAAVTLCFFNAAGAGQVPIQDRQPAGSALRPAVMGPTGGVSTGHPLTTAAAFGILLKGGNAFDAGSPRSSPAACSSRISTASAVKRSSSSIRKKKTR